MKTKGFTLLFIVLILSCNDDKVSNELYEYHFFTNSQLTINFIQDSYMKYGIIDDGTSTVFKYYYKAEDDEQIADDEYSEYIYFQVDSSLNSFEIKDEALEDANTILSKSCFCYFPDSPNKNVPPKGIISGKKLSNDKWKITLNITFYGDERRSFEAIFKLKEN